MAREWFHVASKAASDETVASFVERHYGPEIVDRLVDPLLSGIYGGAASELSVRAVLPRFAEMEANHGSLGRAMLWARNKTRQAPNAPPRPLFTSLKDGMQQMVDAVVARLSPAALRINTPVLEIRRGQADWFVSAGAQADTFDGVIVAVPTQTAAPLLRSCSPALRAELGGIHYSSPVTVTLGYDNHVRQSLPPGFGFLVPRSEGKRMLAATFVHNKFPHRAPDDRALLRCFLGGARDEQILALPENEILVMVRAELRQILNLTTEPRFARVFKWKGAMAQYG